MSLLTRMRVVISYKALRNPFVCHKSLQEAMKDMKNMTHFLAFPVRCGLTYIDTRQIKRFQTHGGKLENPVVQSTTF